MPSNFAIHLAILSLICGLDAGAARARAFAFNFHEAPEHSVLIEAPQTVAQTPLAAGDDDAGPSSFLSADLMAMTMIIRDVEEPDYQPQAAPVAPVIGFANLFTSPAPPPVNRGFQLVSHKSIGPGRYVGWGRSAGHAVARTRIAAVPVPPALPLLAGGLGALVLLRRRGVSAAPGP